MVSIVGTDEVGLNRNHISWVSPLGRARMKSAAGDSVVVQLPGVHPKTETGIMVTVLDHENSCHERTRISQSVEWS